MKLDPQAENNPVPTPDTSDEIRIDDVWRMMDELRGMAHALLAGEGDAHSVRPTALVMSVLLANKPKDQEWNDVSWKNRHYFFGAMYQAMKRKLVDYARARKALKRAQIQYVSPEILNFFDLPGTMEDRPEQIEVLMEALEELEREDVTLAQIVQYRYFTGMTMEELGRQMAVAEKTIQRKWLKAKLLLHQKILRIFKEQGYSTDGLDFNGMEPEP